MAAGGLTDAATQAVFHATEAESCDEANRKLLALTTLSLSGFGIADLTVLEGLEQLVSLDLSDNPVHDLAPLRGLESLRRLDVTGTAVVSAAPLAGLISAGLDIVGLPGPVPVVAAERAEYGRNY
jgi:hypothetical protein